MYSVLVVAAVAAVTVAGSLPKFSAVCSGSNDDVVAGLKAEPSCVFHNGSVSGSTAWAEFSNGINVTGWADLRMHGNPNSKGAADSITYFAMGYLEGYLTAQMMCDFTNNYEVSTFNGNETLRALVVTFLQDSYQWTMEQVAANSSVYWTQVGYSFSQLHGLMAGHAAAPVKSCSITLDNLLLANVQGGVGDIISAVDVSSRPDVFAMTRREVDAFRRKRSHCSAFVRFLPDMSDVYCGHNTWSSYIFMNRIFKLYSFPDPLDNAKTFTMQFSSYPSCLTSVDDFFQLSTGLWVSETTNDIFNMTLYDLVQPKSLLSWTRTVVTNALARTGPAWTNMFGWYNSGTYNNMWIIFNYNLFKPGHSLVNETLMIVEQIPGDVRAHDMTGVLQYGYFPSYNEAYDRYIRDVSGYTEMEKQFGNDFSYQGDPRAEIFRRDAFKVQSVEDMKLLMQYNDWQHDPLSGGDATQQIASRYDLSDDGPSAGGAIDAKITCTALMHNGTVYAISGPTHVQQPVFVWTKEWSEGNPHQGQPTAFDFDWQAFGQ